MQNQIKVLIFASVKQLKHRNHEKIKNLEDVADILLSEDRDVDMIYTLMYAFVPIYPLYFISKKNKGGGRNL